MTNFDQLIKNLKDEVEALKTVKRKSSTTFETATHAATATALSELVGPLDLNRNPTAIITRAALVKIVANNPDEPFIFSWTLEPFSTRGRDVIITPWIMPDGAPALHVVPSPGTYESGNISIKVNITATSEFTTESSQIIYYRA